ncbi:MAG: hypothetical protein OQK04_03525 [Kangiellaceae bacterium]|nr:hypothetical protein [Kangiellaceae bacterium]MCW8997763.1 hypothetical protein [Kangiellaceae bacterium]
MFVTKMKKIIEIMILTLILSACVTTVVSVNEYREGEIGSDKALVFIVIDTERNLENIKISGPESIMLTSEYLTVGKNYLLFELENGIYTLESAKLGRFWEERLNNEQLLQFEVNQGQVNYTGHLNIYISANRDSLLFGMGAELQDCTSKAILYLEKEFPNLISNSQLKYVGNQESNFKC